MFTKISLNNVLSGGVLGLYEMATLARDHGYDLGQLTNLSRDEQEKRLTAFLSESGVSWRILDEPCERLLYEVTSNQGNQHRVSERLLTEYLTQQHDGEGFYKTAQILTKLRRGATVEFKGLTIKRRTHESKT